MVDKEVNFLSREIMFAKVEKVVRLVVVDMSQR